MAGRPTLYTDKIADRICELLIDGESLIDVCARPGLPKRTTVYRWMDAHPEFGALCARAREGQGDYFAHQALVVARASTVETWKADGVKIRAYQWIAEKLNARYGRKLDLSATVAIKSVSASPLSEEDWTELHAPT